MVRLINDSNYFIEWLKYIGFVTISQVQIINVFYFLISAFLSFLFIMLIFLLFVFSSNYDWFQESIKIFDAYGFEVTPSLETMTFFNTIRKCKSS